MCCMHCVKAVYFISNVLVGNVQLVNSCTLPTSTLKRRILVLNWVTMRIVKLIKED